MNILQSADRDSSHMRNTISRSENKPVPCTSFAKHVWKVFEFAQRTPRELATGGVVALFSYPRPTVREKEKYCSGEVHECNEINNKIRRR